MATINVTDREGNQLELPATNGYDHCFVVNGQPGELRTCGIVRDPASGRVMEVLSYSRWAQNF